MTDEKADFQAWRAKLIRFVRRALSPFRRPGAWAGAIIILQAATIWLLVVNVTEAKHAARSAAAQAADATEAGDRAADKANEALSAIHDLSVFGSVRCRSF